MTDNHDLDDLNHLETEGETPQVRQGFGANLTEAWRTKPLFKLMVIVIVVGAVVAVLSSFIAPEKPSNASARVVTPPEIHKAPGGTTSPYMKQQTDLADMQRTKDALQNDGSALPTPTGRVSDLDELEKHSDPLKELKVETERLKQELVQVKQTQKQQQQQVIVPPPTSVQPKQPEVNDDALAQAMQHEMGVLVDGWKPHGLKAVMVSSSSEGDTSAAAGTAGASGANLGSANSFAPAVTIHKTLIPAGTVNYSQLLTEANSDVPGPVMVQILSGPFSGARAIGNFQIKYDYLVLHFNLVNFKGKDYPINAYALDPDTTLAGMATEVDDRYFARVVLPAAAGFLQGLGQALGQVPSSVVTNGTSTIVTQSGVGFNQGMYQGLGRAAQTAGQFFDNQANNTKQLVRIASGTPVGLFFVTTVTDQTLQEQQQSNAAAALAQGRAGGANPSSFYRPGAAYPGTTVTGYGDSGAVDGGVNPNPAASPPIYTSPTSSGAATGYPPGFYVPGTTNNSIGSAFGR